MKSKRKCSFMKKERKKRCVQQQQKQTKKKKEEKQSKGGELRHECEAREKGGEKRKDKKKSRRTRRKALHVVVFDLMNTPLHPSSLFPSFVILLHTETLSIKVKID